MRARRRPASVASSPRRVPGGAALPGRGGRGPALPCPALHCPARPCRCAQSRGAAAGAVRALLGARGAPPPALGAGRGQAGGSGSGSGGARPGRSEGIALGSALPGCEARSRAAGGRFGLRYEAEVAAPARTCTQITPVGRWEQQRCCISMCPPAATSDKPDSRRAVPLLLLLDRGLRSLSSLAA